MKQLEMAGEKQAFDQGMRQREFDLKVIEMQNEYEQYVSQAQARVIAEQNEREQMLIKLAADEDSSVRELLAKVGMHQKSEETKKLLSDTDFALKQAELIARMRNMQAKPGGFDSFG